MSQMIDFTLPSCVPGRTLHAFRCVPEGEVAGQSWQLSHGHGGVHRPVQASGRVSGRGRALLGHRPRPSGPRRLHPHQGGLRLFRPARRQPRRPRRPPRCHCADEAALSPASPIFLLGHSMGSFSPGSTFASGGDELDGAIIMGTGFQPKRWSPRPGRSAGCWPSFSAGSTAAAGGEPLLPRLQQGLEGRTPQDWLNRDQAEVDKYRADERCMFTFTLNAYYSMFTGILRLYDPAVLAGMPKDLPLLFLAGDADPVGERTAGVRRAIQSLRGRGVGNIESKFYPAPAMNFWWRRTKPRCLRTSPAGSKNSCIFESKAPSSD